MCGQEDKRRDRQDRKKVIPNPLYFGFDSKQLFLLKITTICDLLENYGYHLYDIVLLQTKLFSNKDLQLWYTYASKQEETIPFSTMNIAYINL